MLSPATARCRLPRLSAVPARQNPHIRNGTYTGSPDDDCLLQDRAGKMEIPMSMMALKDHTDIAALAAMAHFASRRPVLAGNHASLYYHAPPHLSLQHNITLGTWISHSAQTRAHDEL